MTIQDELARVTGIAGVFLRACVPAALAAWYQEDVGVPAAIGGTRAVVAAEPDGRDASRAPLTTVWSPVPADTPFSSPGPPAQAAGPGGASRSGGGSAP